MQGTILSGNVKTLYLIAVPIAFLIVSLWLRRKENLKQYFQIFFAFFIASFVYMIISPFGGGEGVEGKTLNIVTSCIMIVVSVLVLNKLAGNDLRSIYIKKGNLRSGLIIGMVTFLFFLITCIPASMFVFGGAPVTSDQLIAWAPWLAVLIFANALREELLWRGLFLKKYDGFVGKDPSNLLQAIIFGFAHFYLSASLSGPLLLVGITTVLGLGFGAAMQKTDSLLASILFHAGSDIPFMIAVLSVL